MRHDLRVGHRLEAEALLRSRVKASQLQLTDDRIVELADSLRDVDRARAEREAREAADADDAGRGSTAQGGVDAATGSP